MKTEPSCLEERRELMAGRGKRQRRESRHGGIGSKASYISMALAFHNPI